MHRSLNSVSPLNQTFQYLRFSLLSTVLKPFTYYTCLRRMASAVGMLPIRTIEFSNICFMNDLCLACISQLLKFITESTLTLSPHPLTSRPTLPKAPTSFIVSITGFVVDLSNHYTERWLTSSLQLFSASFFSVLRHQVSADLVATQTNASLGLHHSFIR